jgi:glycosyltransferase involved in cell wall biosynthesis
MCVKDCENLVKDAIDSVIAQDFCNQRMELIVVDDGSEDKTLAITLDASSKADVGVRVYTQKWRGLGPARNVVVNNAHGEYIIWVDGDMVLPPDHVTKQVEFMQKNPRVGIAKAKHGVFPGESLVATLENLSFLAADLKYKRKAALGLLGTGGCIYRVEAIRQINGFDNDLTGVGEDQDAARKILNAGWLFDRTNAVFYERRRSTWKALWNEYVWWGYGMHQTLTKNKDMLRLYKMLPISGFLAGILDAIETYRFLHQKKVFLLPIESIFRMVAWWVGFAKSYRTDYNMN